MSGIQETVYFALMELAQRVESGEFGQGDHFDDDALQNKGLDSIYCQAS